MPPTITAEQAPDEELNTILGESVPQGVETMVSEAGPYLGVIIGAVIAVLVALAVTVVSSMVMKRVLRDNPVATRAINRTRLPLFFALTMIGSRITVRIAAEEMAWYPAVAFVLFIGIVVGLAWWAMRVVRIIEAVVLDQYTGDGGVEDRRGRRVQTQISLIRRILTAVIITLAISAILLMIPQVRALGAGLLASAGVVSVVVGLALQSTLTNIFAGVQLAFTDSIRVGDVVVVESTFASVEDITLSAVVLKVWDERRVIYPSSYFVATPFENWTRVGTELLGTVELDVDWRVPMEELRGRLKRLVESTDLWDGVESSIQVTDAVGGMAKARAVVSARNSGELWDLRCLVREDLVNYLRAQHPYAVVTQRMLVSHEDALIEDSQQVNTGQLGPFAQAREPRAGDTAEQTPAPAPGQAPSPNQGSTAEPADPSTGRLSQEEMEFLRRYGSAAGPAVGSDTDETPLTQAGEGSSVFTGSIAALERNRDFSGPGEEVHRERRERQDEGDEIDDADEPDDVVAGQS